MNKGDRVEYQVEVGCYSFGIIESADHDREMIQVRDEFDGSLWEGLMDYAQLEPHDTSQSA